MTAKEKGAPRAALKKILPLSEILIIAVFLIMLKLSDTVSTGAWSGLVLTAGTILPSVFPFMVLGDFLSCYVANNGLGIFERAIRRIFGVDGSEVGIVASGLLCGFPSSARAVSEAYKNGRIEKEKAERLAALTSNPSPPFIIGALGEGLFKSGRIGAVIFLALLLSIAATSITFSKKRQKSIFPDITSRQKYNFVESVKKAGEASIIVFSFVTLFCTLIEIIRLFVGVGALFSVLVSFLEVSTALVHLISECDLPSVIVNALIGFSVGFGGVCANLQCSAFLSEAGLKVGKFFVIKLALGAFCALFTTALLSFI